MINNDIVRTGGAEGNKSARFNRSIMKNQSAN